MPTDHSDKYYYEEGFFVAKCVSGTVSKT